MNLGGDGDAVGPLVWDDRLDSGVLAIDLQHRVLFQMLQRVAAIHPSDSGAALDQVLEQLRSYADYHFRYEEAWMLRQQTDAAAHARHLRLHSGFVESLSSMKAQLEQGRLTIMDLERFLRRWLIGHILEQDMPIIRALQPQASTA